MNTGFNNTDFNNTKYTVMDYSATTDNRVEYINYSAQLLKNYPLLDPYCPNIIAQSAYINERNRAIRKEWLAIVNKNDAIIHARANLRHVA